MGAALLNGGITYDDLASCCQVEGDGRLLLYTAAVQAREVKKKKKKLSKTVDTGVVVLAITLFHDWD